MPGTLFRCHCGEYHDTAKQGPCPIVHTFEVPTSVPASTHVPASTPMDLHAGCGHGAVCPNPYAPCRTFMFSELDRYFIILALQARHPKPCSTVQSIIKSLWLTPEELEGSKQFAKDMLKKLRQDSKSK